MLFNKFVLTLLGMATIVAALPVPGSSPNVALDLDGVEKRDPGIVSSVEGGSDVPPSKGSIGNRDFHCGE